MEAKVKIGVSDYSRQEMERGGDGFAIGDSGDYFIETIRAYESAGYTVRFETSFWRKVFCMGIYKVMAYKNDTKK